MPFLPAIVVLIFGAIAYAGARREEEATRLVTQTHRVIEESQQVLGRLVDAETGERGFIITGDPRYLEPYRGAAADVGKNIQSVRRLTLDNPRQQARLDTLESLTRRRIDTLNHRIATREKLGFENTRMEFLGGGGGRPLMDSVRQLLADIQRDEQNLLAAQNASRKRYARGVLWIVVIGSVAVSALSLILSLVLSGSASAQRRLATQLRRRSDEIEAANDELQQQALEMEMLNEELQSTNEELEQRSAEAQDANRVKADFLANMSHDLRTPLNAIVGYVDLLDAEVRGPVTPQQRKDLHRIKRSGRHLLSLINEVLDFAKLEAGQIQFQFADVAVTDVLAELHPLVEPQISAKGLRFKTACEPDLVARADRAKLDQILVNLVSNAIKFTDEGGSIDIVCRGDGSSVVAEVTDTGVGIPAEQLSAIFNPFVQVARHPYSREDHGVGLGLSISRQLAWAMNGDLTVTSTPGAGSTFTLLLPRVAQSAGSPTASESAPLREI